MSQKLNSILLPKIQHKFRQNFVDKTDDQEFSLFSHVFNTQVPKSQKWCQIHTGRHTGPFLRFLGAFYSHQNWCASRRILIRVDGILKNAVMQCVHCAESSLGHPCFGRQTLLGFARSKLGMSRSGWRDEKWSSGVWSLIFGLESDQRP